MQQDKVCSFSFQVKLRQEKSSNLLMPATQLIRVFSLSGRNPLFHSALSFCQNIPEIPTTSEELALWKVEKSNPFIEIPQAWVTTLAEKQVSLNASRIRTTFSNVNFILDEFQRIIYKCTYTCYRFFGPL